MLGIVETVAGVVDNVLDKFIEDKDLKTKLNHELKKSVQDANLAQIQANIEQAKHICNLNKQHYIDSVYLTLDDLKQLSEEIDESAIQV